MAGRILVWVLSLVLIFAVIGGIAVVTAKSSMGRRYPSPGRLVEVNGSRMHLNCMGSGSPAVILEAGLDDFSIFWVLVQPEVAEFTTVCAYDRAGLGWSESVDAPRELDNLVGELHSLITNANIDKPVVLVGHSFGGAVVRMYAHDYPAEVAGMVLVDAAHEELFVQIPAWEKPTAQMIGLYNTLAPLSSLGLLALAPQSIPNRGLPAKVLSQYRAIAATTGYFESANDERKAFEGNLARLRAANARDLEWKPLIVVSRGLWEPPLPGITEAENAQAWEAWQQMQVDLATLPSTGQQVIAEQSGHHIQLQQPELVIEAVRRVVEAVNRPD